MISEAGQAFEQLSPDQVKELALYLDLRSKVQLDQFGGRVALQKIAEAMRNRGIDLGLSDAQLHALMLMTPRFVSRQDLAGMVVLAERYRVGRQDLSPDVVNVRDEVALLNAAFAIRARLPIDREPFDDVDPRRGDWEKIAPLAIHSTAYSTDVFASGGAVNLNASTADGLVFDDRNEVGFFPDYSASLWLELNRVPDGECFAAHRLNTAASPESAMQSAVFTLLSDTRPERAVLLADSEHAREWGAALHGVIAQADSAATLQALLGKERQIEVSTEQAEAAFSSYWHLLGATDAAAALVLARAVRLVPGPQPASALWQDPITKSVPLQFIEAWPAELRYEDLVDQRTVERKALFDDDARAPKPQYPRQPFDLWEESRRRQQQGRKIQ